MTLKEFIDSEGISTYQFARMMKDAGREVNQSVAWRWYAGKQNPAWETVAYITRATKGKVQANDFVLPID
jgi:hypothetical protein